MLVRPVAGSSVAEPYRTDSVDMYRFLGFSNGFAAACHDWTGLARSVSRFSVCRSLEPICCGRTGLDRISPKCSRISGKPKMKRRVKPALKPRGNAKRRVELHRCKILGFWLSGCRNVAKCYTDVKPQPRSVSRFLGFSVYWLIVVANKREAETPRNREPEAA